MNTKPLSQKAQKLTMALALWRIALCAAPAQTAVEAWVRRYNGSANAFARANGIAVDSSGNVVVTGYSSETTFVQNFATIKYSSTGEPLWTNLYFAPDGAQGSAVAVDSQANVFVAGGVGGRGPSPNGC